MKIDRLMSIIMELLNCDKISAPKLAEKFEVTPRTIYRDIDTIAMAGIPIVTNPGVNGGISIMPEYKVDKKFFSASEISTLLIGLSSVSSTLSGKDVAGTLAKVKNLLPEKQIKEIELQANQIRIDLTTWMGQDQLKPSLDLIKHALVNRKYLVFDYYGLNGKKNKRRIEPCQLILKEGKWYIYGYCTLRDDFRIFKITRMSSPELSEDRFVPRKFTSKPLNGTGWIGNRLITLKLRVHNSLREQMLEFCCEEKIKPYDKDRLLVDLPFTEDDYGYNILIGFGDKCECIEPLHVRKELVHRIKRLMNVYESMND